MSENLWRGIRTDLDVGQVSCDLLRVPAGEGEVLQRRADGALCLGTLQRS